MSRPSASRVIDFHVHTLEACVLKASENRTVTTGFGTGASSARPGADAFFRKMLDAEAQVRDLDERGIGRAVISSSTVIQGSTWADPQTDDDLCRRTNDDAAGWVARHPERFIGSFVLPLQDVDRSLRELERSVRELKLRVANVSTSYHGVYLGEPRYHAFWEAVQALDVAVWIHPEGIRDLWFQKYALWNSLGQSIEETRAMASLIYEGVMEKFPRLKIVMAHGGGYFPHYLGRVDRNAVNRPDTMKHIVGKPSDYLGRFYYDTCVYDPNVIRSLVRLVGTGRLVMGSDYPVGERDPVGFLAGCGIEGAELERVAGGNAAELLGLA